MGYEIACLRNGEPWAQAFYGGKKVYHLGIDVRTKDKNKLMTRLRGLVSTVTVEDGGQYHEDASYSQVWVTTHKTEKELDDWLYTTKGIEYVGTFARKESA